MKNTVLKKISIATLLVIGIGIFNTGNVFAGDNNLGFSYTIKTHYNNSYSWSEFRQTYDKRNPWKVNLRTSGEGSGSVTRFWLHEFSGNVPIKKVSDWHNVKQGSGAKYFASAYSSANRKYVSLGAENNTDTSYTYKVSGYWDEETW